MRLTTWLQVIFNRFHRTNFICFFFHYYQIDLFFFLWKFAFQMLDRWRFIKCHVVIEIFDDKQSIEHSYHLK